MFRFCPLADHGADGDLCCVTIVTKHLTYGKLLWFLIVFTRWTIWNHCQQNYLMTFMLLYRMWPGSNTKHWPLALYTNIIKSSKVVSLFKWVNRVASGLFVFQHLELRKADWFDGCQVKLWMEFGLTLYLYRVEHDLWRQTDQRWRKG